MYKKRGLSTYPPPSWRHLIMFPYYRDFFITLDFCNFSVELSVLLGSGGDVHRLLAVLHAHFDFGWSLRFEQKLEKNGNFLIFETYLNGNGLVIFIECCYETILSGPVTFIRHRCECGRALCLPYNYYVLPPSVVHWHRPCVHSPCFIVRSTRYS